MPSLAIKRSKQKQAKPIVVKDSLLEKVKEVMKPDSSQKKDEDE